jgi:hypothetical protein
MRRTWRAFAAALGPLAVLATMTVGLASTPVAALAPKMTVAVIGDYGCQPGSNCRASGANQLAVAKLVHSWSPNAIVTVGDNSYENGSAAAVAADQAPYAADIAAGNFYPTPGNHDWLNGSIQPSTDIFHRPPHYAAPLGGGLVDLFVTDMNGQDPDGDSATSDQADQYRASVAASTAVWKITAGHQAFYSSGEHGSNEYTHWAILPQIDLFLSGHDHDFEHLVVDDKNFVVDGVGGRNRYAVCTNGCLPGSAWHDDQDFGAVRLTITPTSLLVEFIEVGGQVLHSFRLSKSGGAAARTGSAPAAAPTALPGASGASQPQGVSGSSVPLPIRAAFYYPWYPESWSQQGMDPFTRYHPAAGFYDSANAATVKKQIGLMKYGKIDAGIASWWGPQTPTDGRVAELLKAAAGTNFHWALLYEPEGQGDPSASQVDSDLQYIRTRYASDPAYLRVNGRFVVFVYAGPKESCGMTERWQQAKEIGAYVMLKVYPGFRTCQVQPDGWYQYSPDISSVSVRGFSTTISPGFWKATETTARLPRDPTRWRGDVRRLVASKAPFQLITSFNEWGEGTAIEPAKEWSDGMSTGAYLEALHDDGATNQRAVLGASGISALFQAIWAPALLIVAMSGLALTRWRRFPPGWARRGSRDACRIMGKLRSSAPSPKRPGPAARGKE